MKFAKSITTKALKGCAGALAVFAVAAVPTAANAQQFLDNIFVTAQKRTENIQDVPFSLTALTGEKIDVLKSGAGDIRFLRGRVPSLYIESSFGRTFPRFYIRGLGNTDFDLNASQPVELVYDEVILENPVLKGFPVFDLDRIEVLRGPQGTLFGRNTPAGIVKFDSKKPSQEFDAYGRIGFGRYDTIDVEGAAGGPILENVLSGRVSFLFQRRDDWIDNLFTGVSGAEGGFEEFAGRGQLLLEPNDEVSVLLNVHGRKLDGTARIFQGNLFNSGMSGIRSGFNRDEIFHDGPNSQDVNEYGGVLNMSWDLGSVTLTSVTGYEHVEIFTKGDIDGGFGDFFGGVLPTGVGIIPFATTTQDNIPDLDQWTQEIRVASNELGIFDFQIGGFFFNETLDAETLDFGANNAIPVAVAVQSQDTTSWAAFGSVDIEVTDQLTVAGGLRYSRDTKDFTASRTIDTRPGFLGFGGVFTPMPVSTKDGVIAWDASAVFALNDDVNLYARVARGFRAPSIQGRIAFFALPLASSPNDSVSVADTEKILSFEGGIKATTLGGRARVNIGGFYYRIKDQQITAVGGGGNFNTLLNADKTKGIGFEFDAEVAVTDNFLVTAGTSFNHTEIQDSALSIQPCGAPGFLGVGCTVLDPLDGMGNALIDGNSLPNAPEWIANITARYGFDCDSLGGEFYIYTDWAYRSRINFFLYESVEFQDDYMLEGGVRIGFTDTEGTWEVAAFGRNITNDVSATGGIDFNNLTGFVNEPRVWGVEVLARL